MLIKQNNIYNKRAVIKPWGYEYIVYDDKDKIGITFLNIKYKHKTSLHCHPNKKTGFIILDGRAEVQIGIYKKNAKYFDPMSRLVFRQGLFHSLKARSKSGLYALEFETPYNKKDLVRLKDDYGRKKKSYEGKGFTRNLDSDKIKFSKPKLGEKNIYRFNNIEISLEKTSNLDNLSSKDDSSLAILDGYLVDKNGIKAISYGEIIKTSTLKILYKNFKIKEPLVILRVYKTKIKKKKNYKLNLCM
tara:strand:- start:5743 stop:6477 length:735 start_codon:yes stop_codon:yes gene_type:complete